LIELRILNGLHRGATLPLDTNAYVIGADDEADVVLTDPGIEARHARVQLVEGGWSLASMDGPVRDALTNREQEQLALETGDFARVGPLWISVVESGVAWQAPPPEPDDDAGSAILDGEAEPEAREDAVLGMDGAVDGPEPVPEAGAEKTEAEKAETEADSRVQDAPSDPALATEEPPPEQKATGPKAAWYRPRRVYMPIAVVTVLTACAYTMAISPDRSSPDSGVASGLHEPGKPGNRPKLTDASPIAPLTGEELRSAFRKRLEEVALLSYMELDLRDGTWSMKASFDAEESERFGRVLVEFVKQHKITFPIQAKVGNAESMLPFKVGQVISGADASVVTSDGARIYVGDTYRGMRLLAINGKRLTFAGKRKIEVVW
jgi:type III secretion protein D